MSKSDGTGTRPKSSTQPNDSGKKNDHGKLKPQKKKGRGKTPNPGNANLFSMILDGEGKEDENNGEISIGGVAKQDARQEAKENVEKILNAFGHKMYENAAVIYAYFNGDVAATLLPKFTTEYEKRRAYGIAFAAKRYEEVLKDVILDSHFYSMYSKFEGQHNSKVMVMLMDYFDHNFRFSDSKRKVIKPDTENPQELIREIQDAIVSHHVHICASFARCRIRDCAVSIEDLVADDGKELHTYAHHQPMYVRINTFKATADDIVRILTSEGFVLSDSVKLLELTGKMFRIDPHFDDLLAFSNECKDEIYCHNLISDSWLHPQNKAKHLVVEVVKSMLVELAMQKDKAMNLVPGQMATFLVTDGDDVLLTNPDSGSLSAHLASFINPERKLFICGCSRGLQRELENRMATSGVKNFVMIEEPFTNVVHSDERLRKVRIIVCNVPCSKSAVVNPVDFVLQEGNDAAKLLVGKIDVGRQKAIISDESMILKHAFTYTHVQQILYYTLSVNSAENEGLVMSVLKEHREQPTVKNPFQMETFLPDLVSNLRSHIKEAEGGTGSLFARDDDKYLNLKPSSCMNGCFIAVLKRQYLDGAPKDAMDRAGKKGAKSRVYKKSLAQKQSKDAADQEEEIVDEGHTAKETESKKGNTFQRFF